MNKIIFPNYENLICSIEKLEEDFVIPVSICWRNVNKKNN